LGSLLEVLRWLSVLVWPAMPAKSDEMRQKLGLLPLAPKVGEDLWALTVMPRPAGEPLAPSASLFPTFDKEAEAKLLARLVPRAPTTIVPLAPSIADSLRTPELERSTSISYDQFANVDLRVGIVKDCERIPKKDKLLRLSVDLGEKEPRTIIAGLAMSFSPESLKGKKIIVVANLAPRDFGKGLVSHGMLLATGPSEALRLATVDGDATPGMRLK